METNRFTAVWAFGTKDFNAFGNGFDASDKSDAVHLANYPIKSFYLADGIANYKVNNRTYLITANEGDEKEYEVLNERTTVGDVTLDPTIFPNAAELQQDYNLGRLRISNLQGDTDNDGDYDQLFMVGARSFSIWDAAAKTLVYDSKNDFEFITATDPNVAPIFNADNEDNEYKSRSRSKGPEPEGVTTATINNKAYAFITLERIGGVMVYDVTDPNQVKFVDYKNNRSLTEFAGDHGPEGIIFISGQDSPDKKNYIAVANEISGTVALYEVIENKRPASVFNLRYGGSGTDRFTTVIKTADGGYISGGYSNSGVSGDKSQPSQGGYDFWIVKTDVNGVKLWDKTYGGSGDDYLNRIIPTKDGGYLLAGSSKSGVSGDKSEVSRGEQDFWIIKIDANGTKQWDKTYGGSGLDDLRKVNQLTDGGYILAGHSNSALSGDKSQESRGNTDYWLVRIDQNGSKLWDKRYGGTHHDYLETFTKTSDGGFLLAGSSASGFGGDKTQGSKGSRDYWLVKIDSNGKKVWDKAYGGSGKDELSSIGYNAEGNYFVAGTSSSGKSGDKSQESKGSSDYWMLLLNQQGDKLWDKGFGGSGTEELRSVIQSKQGGYILAGSSDSNISGDKTQDSQGGTDYWVVKTDAQGNKEYDQRFGGSGTEEFRYIQQEADGGLLLGGRSDSGVSGDRTQPSQGATDYWLVKVAPFAETNGSIISSKGSRQETENAPASLRVNAFPNPLTESVNISFSLPQTQPVSVRVYDSHGKEVATLYQDTVQAFKSYDVSWRPKTGQPAGLYILRLNQGNKSNSLKLLLRR